MSIQLLPPSRRVFVTGTTTSDPCQLDFEETHRVPVFWKLTWRRLSPVDEYERERGRGACRALLAPLRWAAVSQSSGLRPKVASAQGLGTALLKHKDRRWRSCRPHDEPGPGHWRVRVYPTQPDHGSLAVACRACPVLST